RGSLDERDRGSRRGRQLIEHLADALVGHRLRALPLIERAQVVAGAEVAASSANEPAANSARIAQRPLELVEHLVVDRIAAREILQRELPHAARHVLDRDFQPSTTNTSPSLTACASLQRISLTTPASGASTGISIFI